MSKNPGGGVEFIVPGASKNNPGKYIGFVDMALPSTGEFYEIKHRYGQGKAADEVLHYMAYLNKPGSRTSATGEWVAGDTYLGDGEPYQFGLWPIGLSQNYNPAVDGYYRIMAQLDQPGVIHYWAEPLGKDEKARNYNYNPAHVEQFIDLKYPGLRRRSYPGGAQPLPEEPDNSVLGQAGTGAVVVVCIIKVAEIIAGAVLGGPVGAGAGALAPVP